MKLRNKKTGEIAVIRETIHLTKENDICCGMGSYNSLAELNDEWEDYEEKDHWYINYQGEVYVLDPNAVPEYSRNAREIGNYFETREEAEQAVEKLKAWKRLKDKGLVIKKWRHTPDMHLTTGSFLKIEGFIPEVMKNINDLDLLFSGGEE